MQGAGHQQGETQGQTGQGKSPEGRGLYLAQGVRHQGDEPQGDQGPDGHIQITGQRPAIVIAPAEVSFDHPA